MGGNGQGGAWFDEVWADILAFLTGIWEAILGWFT